MYVAILIGLAIAGVEITSDLRAVSNDRMEVGSPEVAKLLPGDFDWGADPAGPLCGIFSACTALRLMGIDADPSNYIATRYLGQCGGSTPQEVSNIIRDAGARAHILNRLSAFDLRSADRPFIANVRVSQKGDRYDHWAVVVPRRDGVCVYDGLQKPFQISMAEFLASWSGMGIYVARDDTNPLIPVYVGRLSLVLTILTAVALLYVNREVVWRASGSTVLRQVCLLFIASIPLAIAGALVFGDLPHCTAGMSIATYIGQDGDYRVGTLDDVEAASRDGNFLLVDARMQRDYQRRSIDGAVNIPVTASIWKVRQYVENLNRDTPVIVFCQSARCGYDEIVAGLLTSLGFTDVMVCDEGWSEYKIAKSVAISQTP